MHVTEIVDFAEQTDSLTHYITEKMFDINAKNNLGEPLLISTINYRDVDMIKLLISNRADVNIQDINGNTPLHIASNIEYRELKRELIELLINAGANKDIINNNGEKPNIEDINDDINDNYNIDEQYEEYYSDNNNDSDDDNNDDNYSEHGNCHYVNGLWSNRSGSMDIGEYNTTIPFPIIEKNPISRLSSNYQNTLNKLKSKSRAKNSEFFLKLEEMKYSH